MYLLTDYQMQTIFFLTDLPSTTYNLIPRTIDKAAWPCIIQNTIYIYFNLLVL